MPHTRLHSRVHRGVLCTQSHRSEAPLGGAVCARSHVTPSLPQGAFGEVHRVLVTPESGPAFEAARKQMSVGSPYTRSVFEAEVHALTESLGCTNIVQILDARTTDEYHEILLELLKGDTLTWELVSTALLLQRVGLGRYHWRACLQHERICALGLSHAG